MREEEYLKCRHAMEVTKCSLYLGRLKLAEAPKLFKYKEMCWMQELSLSLRVRYHATHGTSAGTFYHRPTSS